MKRVVFLLLAFLTLLNCNSQTLDQTDTLKIKVLEDSTNAPISGVSLSVWDSNGDRSFQTDSTGYVTVPIATDSIYSFHIWHREYLSESLEYIPKASWSDTVLYMKLNPGTRDWGR